MKIVTPVVGFGAILLFQVLYDDFIRHIPAAGHEVPSCPEVPTQNCLAMCLNSIISLRELLPLMYYLLHDMLNAAENREVTTAEALPRAFPRADNLQFRFYVHGLELDASLLRCHVHINGIRGPRPG